MKKAILISFFALAGLAGSAQFTKATLQATGLTCAMCSNAINKALQKIPFVASVRSDIKNSSFEIVFRQDAEVEIDKLKDAVEDAGFSVGKLKITGKFTDVKVEKDQHMKIGKENFHLLNSKEPLLNGELTLTLMDKNFITEKEFKKISKGVKSPCLQTGKAAICCEEDGIKEGERVYHVII